ncbi:STAS domain-containing protein [Actinoplanes sp. NPDC051859]|uniref:STAS domain-containing protein n=1 Tax=Actinoplanes sp. NPDC051859 TaxID=3363909 RepID=UPI0037943D09
MADAGWELQAARQLVVSCFRPRSGALRIRVIGELDAAVAGRFHDQIRALFAGPLGKVELDLAGVGFCDAAGGRAIIAARGRGVTSGVKVLLVAVHPAVRHVLQLLGEDL